MNNTEYQAEGPPFNSMVFWRGPSVTERAEVPEKKREEEERKELSQEESVSALCPPLPPETSSDNGSTGSVNYGRVPPNAIKTEEDEIARAETQRLLLLRGITFIFLLIATVGVSVGVYFFLRTNEENRFQEKFDDTGSKLLEVIGTVLENTLTATDTFAVAATISARSSNSTWPFVTIPEYAVQGSKLRSLSKIFLLSVYHYVEHEERGAWENYTRVNDAWVDEGIQTQKVDPNFRGNIVEEWSTLGEINFFGERAQDADFYIARWQTSPVVPRWDPYNWNAYQHPTIQRAMDPALRNRTVVISESFNIVDPKTGPTEETASTVVNLQDFIGENQFEYEPAVEIYFPVINGPPGQVSLRDKEDAPLVAIISVSIFWRDLITNVLPEGNDGTMVVFSSGCNQSFSYVVNGPVAEYLGEGDKHSGAYEDKSMSSPISDLKFSTADSTYTGPPVDNQFCPYKVTLYPTKAKAEEYLTSTPLILAFVSFSIFVFTSLIFIVYDCTVERRQRKVMWTAKQSSAVVSSLFPSTIKASSLHKDGDENQQPPTSKLFGTLAASGGTLGHHDPLAESFAQSSVLFAKIAGFTEWSSGRDPTEVFILLERLYATVDVLAERHGMYKVENIGDQYVAVAGIPEQRKDHAIAMARFAMDVRTKVRVLTRQLKDRLGEGTDHLCIQIGIHSGEVVAGILRGQRARTFKLLRGKTVSMATRIMESGQGDRIHVSSKTAELILEAGKKRWLKQREDMLEVPDAGVKQTYWIDPS